MSLDDSQPDPTIERAAAAVRRYLADPEACEAALQHLMAQLQAGVLSKDSGNERR